MIKNIMKYLLLTVIGIWLFSTVHAAETIRREYVEYGGELMFVFLPFLWAFCERGIKNVTKNEQRKSVIHRQSAE